MDKDNSVLGRRGARELSEQEVETVQAHSKYATPSLRALSTASNNCSMATGHWRMRTLNQFFKGRHEAPPVYSTKLLKRRRLP